MSKPVISPLTPPKGMVAMEIRDAGLLTAAVASLRDVSGPALLEVEVRPGARSDLGSDQRITLEHEAIDPVLRLVRL